MVGGTQPVPHDAAMEAIGPPILAASRFVDLGGFFDIEYAGPFIRIWCGACDKHEPLPDDEPGTLEAARVAHRCGERVSLWESADLGSRG